ncbi:hypothetical protein MKW94_010703 [Papaver nudicaule]|uniref:TF-B3 domain-containing protein n=1 Tax=Papaver nudicaule TaxID=74823 RepID=A0AA41UXK6_PAPNU|nr:hypothetical protein [Papaver nudicaule]
MEFVKESRDGSYNDHPQEDQEEEVVMADNNSTTSKQLFSSSSSSSFSSLSPSSSSSQYKNVVVHHHHQQQQQQQQQNHQLPANFLSGISNSSATEVIGEFIEKEHMFDKVVTPSDVGKLNRLVIPKQHAEKYFPLDSAANEKGLLLNFEDRSGKPWRFRYSYWNSSQSYVMTKGWSRFVKEKKLDAGDIVSFERGAAESYKDRFYIDWRRRPQAPDLSLHHHHHSNPLSFPRSVIPWGTTHARLFFPQNLAVSSSTRDHLQLSYDHHHHQHQQQQQHYHYHQQQLQQRLASSTTSTSYGNYSNMINNNQGPGSVVYLRSSSSPITTRISDHQAHPQQQQVGLMQQYTSGDNHNNMAMVFDSVPVVHGQAAAKRVRLFGVNLECPISEDDNECDILSSTTIPMNTTTTGGSSIHAHHPHHQILNNPSHPIHSAPTPHLQLRVYNGAPLPTMPTELPKRGRPSLSFDLDI